MTNLIEYLRENKISHKPIDDKYIEISGDKHMLVLPDDGILFDDEFDLITNSTEKGVKYVFCFGERWYCSDTQLKPQLNELKYLGKSKSTVPTEVFLGVHGGYELLNGSRLYKDWVKKAKFIGIHTLGLIEKNTLAGTLKFQLECLKNDIKPIIGATYTVFRESDDYRYDIKCYVQSIKGWESLLLMNKEVNVLNKKFIHESRLLELTEGIIFVLDPKTIDYDKILPLDINISTLYYQLDTVEFEEEQRDMWYLQNLKKFFNSQIKPVSIRDAYYLDKEHSHIKSKLNLISGVFDYKANNQYFKDNEDYFGELCELFGEDDDRLFKVFKSAVRNEQYIAKICNFTIDVDKRHLPQYRMTEEEKKKFEDNEDLFWHLIEEGLKNKAPKDKLSEYIERVEREVEIIKFGEVVDYFLILWDIINWASRNGIMHGIGRGSGGGSLVAYLMGLVEIDPIEFGLLFERFLTKERAAKSLPDLDSDFPGDKRDEVKRYMEERYGVEQVCSVGTYTTLQLKAALKDLTRQENADYSEVNYVTTVLDLDESNVKELFQNAAKKKRIKNFIQEHFECINDISLVMGQPKSQSIHACATLIVPREKDIFRWIPVKKMKMNDGEDILVSEWEGNELETAGFLKEDILGIKQLSKVTDILSLVKENKGDDVDVYRLPLDDRDVYRYFSNGWNGDTFHFGSKGLTEYCKDVKPNNINDLIAAISLYRPGAMENNFHNEYVFRKSGQREIVSYVGAEKILKETYGIFTYQEQILKMCQVLGGIPPEDSDTVRKALGKKKLDILEKFGNLFVENYCDGYGVDEDYAKKVWSDMEKSSSYLFNKSHAAAYTITGYITQWLKVHYPLEFWTVAFNYSDETDIAPYIAEINKTGSIKVLPPEINKSDTSTKTDFKKNAIYWALSAIKQVGETSTDQIMKDKEENGEYFSFGDFVDRHSFKGSKVNKRTIENLILSGCFDLLENIEQPKDRISLITEYREKVKQKIDNEKDIFEGNGKLSYNWWWILQQKRLSGIAFFDYEELVNGYGKTLDDYSYIDPVEFNKESSSGNRIGGTVSGYILEFEERESKKGKFAKLKIENNYQFINVLIWPDQYEQFETFLQECTKKLIIINGTVNYDNYRKTNVLQSNEETEIILLS
jgi:DNA polymerase III subunit alpha